MKTKPTTKTKSKFSFKKNPVIMVGNTINPNSQYGGEFMPITVVNNSLLLLDISETGAYPEDYGFYSCREDFHSDHMNIDVKNKTILFTHNRKFKELSKFLSIIEDKLKIAPTKKSTVYNTHDKVSLIEISDWWNADVVRQQFFTILLRAACKFNLKSTKSDEIERTLKTNEYFSETYPAVELFLSGYNKKIIGKPFYGWDDTFYDKTRKEALTILKK